MCLCDWTILSSAWEEHSMRVTQAAMAAFSKTEAALKSHGVWAVSEAEGTCTGVISQPRVQQWHSTAEDPRTDSAVPKSTQAREQKQSRGKCQSAHMQEEDPGVLGLKGANKSRIFSCSLEHLWGAWPWPRKSSVAVARGRVPWWRCTVLTEPACVCPWMLSCKTWQVLVCS